MAYDVKCRACRSETWATNIVELFNNHTNSDGRFICSKCSGTDTFIYRISDLQEGPDETWERWIKGVIKIDSGIPTYSPYIFLTADSEDGSITGLHFHYYKDTRSQPGGRLKHGHGPGGPPVLSIDDLFTILQHLVSQGIISKDKVRDFAARL
jgi:hypothetical protein